MRLTERLHALLLLLTPRRFRERYRDEILDTHSRRLERAQGRGRVAVVLLSLRELVGALWLVVRLRVRRGGDSQSGSRGRDWRGGSVIDEVVRDVRFAGRTLVRNPAYAATGIVVLMLGIGANTAMFSAINAFFFRPLPFGDPDRLVLLYETNPEFGWTDASAAPANVLDWRESVAAFADVAFYSEVAGQAAYVRDGEPVLIGTNAVAGNFFSVLGVRAALGRTFVWEETWQGNDAVVVLSHGLWTTHFGSDPGVVGRTLEIGGRNVEVIGVMPEGFEFPGDGTELWYPWGFSQEYRESVAFRRAHFVRPVARLTPGVTVSAANAQLQSVVQRLQSEYPETNSVMGAGMMPLRDFLVREVRKPLLILLGSVGLLLLLACVNVANLTLLRSAERGREIAIRHALGAGRLRIGSQMLAESIVLAIGGGILGLAAGWAGVRALAALTPLGIDGATSVALDARVVSFTVAAAVASGILLGLAPALQTSGRNLRAVLTEHGRGASADRGNLRTVRVLVVAEVALAVLLVLAAGLMIRSFLAIRSVDPGFRTDGVLAIRFTIPSTRYPDRDNVLAFYDRLAETLGARPGIQRVGAVAQLPLNGTSWSSQFQAEGWPPERVGFEILHRRADAGYFEALDIPLIRGRMFDSTDRPDGPFVVLINQTFAQQHFPGEDPIGTKIAYDREANAQSTWYEIIGIVGDQHQVSPTQPARAEAFENHKQDWGRGNWIVIRTAVEPMTILPVVREVLKELDPLIPIAQAKPIRDVWRASTAREEFILTLLTIFGGLALLLAAVGVYGVTAQAARRRTREIGIRMALGAARRDVVSLILRQSLVVVAFGLALGVGLSFGATRALRTVLFEVAPTDPSTLTAVLALLAAVAAFACYLPARRATAVDPAMTLKE